MHKVPVGILGASGYAGRELCGLIAQHPALELAFAAANDQRGRRARIGASEVTYVATEDAPLNKAEVVFTALPAGEAAKLAPGALPMFKPAVKALSAEAVGKYALKFSWSDRHDLGIYSWFYLREVCPCAECTAARK